MCSCHPLTDLCIECLYTIFKPDLEGGCIKAEKCTLGENYCIECNTAGNFCNYCEIGLFADKNGGCSYTENCEISYKGECLKCEEDFILVGEKINLKFVNIHYQKILKIVI